MNSISTTLRNIITRLIHNTNYFSKLVRRINLYEIGLTGHKDSVSKSIAQRQGLKQLNSFELWLSSEYIEYECERRQQLWKEIKENL